MQMGNALSNRDNNYSVGIENYRLFYDSPNRNNHRLRKLHDNNVCVDGRFDDRFLNNPHSAHYTMGGQSHLLREAKVP